MKDHPLCIITRVDESHFKVEYNHLYSYIEEHTKGELFALMLNFGFSARGKSVFSQNISGIKHKIGNGFKSETVGAFISYCGTVQSIINKFQIDQQKISISKNIHVFNIDTEGIIYGENELITEFLFPLIQMSSLIIFYGISLSDRSIVPFMDDINHLTNSNFIMSLNSSKRIFIDDKDITVSNLLKLAQNSDLAKELVKQDIKAEIVPYVDFRDKIDFEISKEMNKYFITKIINLIALKTYDNPSYFIDQLKTIYSSQKHEFIHAIFGKDCPSDSILKSITNECYIMIKEILESSDPNDNDVYDEITQAVIAKYNQMCQKAEIENATKESQIKDIIHFIKSKQLNALFAKERKEEEDRLIKLKESQILKEKKVVEFLSFEIANLCNQYVLSMMNYIKIQDSSSLKSLGSFFSSDCHQLIFGVSSFIRKEVIDHINEDVSHLTNDLHKNSIQAALLIDKQIEKNNQQWKSIALYAGGFLIGGGCILLGHPGIGKSICSLLGAKLPFELVLDSDWDQEKHKDCFSFEYSKKTYKADKNEVYDFCTKIGTACKSVYDEFNEIIDFSDIEKNHNIFEPRDYSKFLEELICKESKSD
ncbi:hypothetical protein M9Y10_003709 [Tritrichomonas musculus]|uniref:Guanylate-binding protein N-terminal domain-containing protein n=1 Tax=Tritrichomonas musculus TaxID=1915356 RepID=A0ABR2JRC1_9EUKA